MTVRWPAGRQPKGGGWSALGSLPAAPTAPYANVQVLLHFDARGGAGGIGNFITNNGNDATTWSVLAAGSVDIDNAVPKFGAANASGVAGTQFATPAAGSAAFVLGNNAAWCAEAWVYTTTLGTAKYVVGYTADRGILFATAGNQFSWVGPVGDFVQGGTVLNGVWQHVAVTHAAGILRLFVGGLLVASQSGATDNYADNFFSVGSGDIGGAPWRGRMDDFRLTIGATVYTTSFIPPTAAFPNS